MERIKELCIKHREILVYIIVGGLTTVVAWGCKFLWNAVFYAGTALPTVAQNTVLSVVECFGHCLCLSDQSQMGFSEQKSQYSV